MLEWFEVYGPTILTAITALGSAAGVTVALGKIFKLVKFVKASKAETQEQIKITQAGIVEAFKTAVVPTEWKISVSSQIATQLTDWKQELFAEFDRREKRRDEISVYSLKILSHTKAYDALSKDDQIRTTDLIKSVDEEYCTIDISKT